MKLYYILFFFSNKYCLKIKLQQNEKSLVSNLKLNLIRSTKIKRLFILGFIFEGFSLLVFYG